MVREPANLYAQTRGVPDYYLILNLLYQFCGGKKRAAADLFSGRVPRAPLAQAPTNPKNCNRAPYMHILWSFSSFVAA